MNTNLLLKFYLPYHRKTHVRLCFKQLRAAQISYSCASRNNSPGITSKNLLEASKGFNKRWMCSDKPSGMKLPPLMDFPRLVWPSLIKSMKNFILATFIIRPYMDNEFNLSSFVAGSKKAVEVISNKLSEGDMKQLNGLVSDDIFPVLQKNVSMLSLSQREQLAIDVDDIYFSFPYQVGVIFDEDSKVQKRFVEITMVYHTLKGLSKMRQQGEEPPLNMGMMPEFQDKISICNYRFIREFTKGVEDQWTVNLLNHFKPADNGK